MEKHFCDRPGCDAECTNYRLVMHGTAYETTSQGVVVDTAEMRSREFCRPCGEELRDRFGIETIPREPEPHEDDMPMTDSPAAARMRPPDGENTTSPRGGHISRRAHI